jgi:hypothetical protein
MKLNRIRAVFFPKNFHEKYSYLGSVPFFEDGPEFKAMLGLVLAMDYAAKPKWCPRWFLRFLHLYGNDNSIVRVRNRRLSDLKTKLTGGILIWDYKTKWTIYDLRISIAAPEYLHELSRAIEDRFYRTGYREDLLERIKELNPSFDSNWSDLDTLEDIWKRLLKEKEENETKD